MKRFITALLLILIITGSLSAQENKFRLAFYNMTMDNLDYFYVTSEGVSEWKRLGPLEKEDIFLSTREFMYYAKSSRWTWENEFCMRHYKGADYGMMKVYIPKTGSMKRYNIPLTPEQQQVERNSEYGKEYYRKVNEYEKSLRSYKVYVHNKTMESVQVAFYADKGDGNKAYGWYSVEAGEIERLINTEKDRLFYCAISASKKWLGNYGPIKVHPNDTKNYSMIEQDLRPDDLGLKQYVIVLE